MGQTWRIVAALLLTFAFTAQCSECRLLQQTLLGTTIPVTETPSAGRSCSSVCQNPLLLANAFKTQPASYACTVKSSNGVAGYQTGAGSTTCTVVSGSQVLESQDYNCLCLAPSAVPGLSKPDAAGSCAASCAPYAGENGSPVATSGSSLCMAAPEVGGTNHFGFVSGANTCTYASGNAVTQATNFSCVCAYGGSSASISSATSSGAPPFQLPQTQIATAG